MPCRAMSIIPLEVEAPIKMPTAATAKITLNFAARAPAAGARKFTASLATPTLKSKIAKIKRKPSTTKYRESIEKEQLIEFEHLVKSRYFEEVVA